MAYDKDRAIAAQNAGSTAASIFATVIDRLEPGTDLLAYYDEIRQRVFNGTMELAGAATVIETVEDGVNEAKAATRYVKPQPSSGGSDDPGSLEIRSGKHAGKTIAQVADEDYSYLEWASENMKNEFLRTRIRKFLAA